MSPSPKAILFFCLLMTAIVGKSQLTLPAFSVRELNRGKIQISWNNPFNNCIQLAIQRSTDSTKDFRTIFSAQSPELPANGYVDNKILPVTKRYYRIFYVLEGGAYYFSAAIPIEVTPYATGSVVLDNPSARERINGTNNQTTIFLKNKQLFTLTNEEYGRFRDSINKKTRDGLHRINAFSVEWRPAPTSAKNESLISIYSRNTLVARLAEKEFSSFRDSITTKTKDTLFMVNPFRTQIHAFIPDEQKFVFVYKQDSLVVKLGIANTRKFKDSLSRETRDTLFFTSFNIWHIHPYVPKYVWGPSANVFTNKNGYVTISLSQVKRHKYRIIFFDTDGSELFHIKSIKESELVLDKANFIHAGWFTFELYEDEKLKEKNKFFLSRD